MNKKNVVKPRRRSSQFKISRSVSKCQPKQQKQKMSVHKIFYWGGCFCYWVRLIFFVPASILFIISFTLGTLPRSPITPWILNFHIFYLFIINSLFNKILIIKIWIELRWKSIEQKFVKLPKKRWEEKWVFVRVHACL